MKRILAALIALTALNFAASAQTLGPVQITQLDITPAGLVFDGVASNAAQINNTIQSVSAAGGGVVRLPPGTGMLETSIVMRSNVHLKCDPSATVLKLKAGVNADVIVGLNSYALFGGGTTGGINNFILSGCTFDGNNTNQVAASSSCGTANCVNGFAVYGYRFILRNVRFQNIVGHGIRSEWATGGGNTVGSMEADLVEVTIDTVGRHGWWNNGPHDSLDRKLVVIDAGQEADATYDGVYADTNSSGRHEQFHGWHRGTVTNRVAYQASSVGGHFWVNSDFEGGRQEFEARLGRTTVTASRFFAPFGTNNALVDVKSSGNVFAGNRVSGITLQANYGFAIGPSGAVNQNIITGLGWDTLDTLGIINLANDGGNLIAGRGSSNGGAVICNGTKSALSSFDLSQVGTNSKCFQSATTSSIVYTLCQGNTQQSHTGDVVETLLSSCAIPAGSMGTNGRLRVTLTGTYTTGNTNTKQFFLRFGTANDVSGTACFNQSTATSANQSFNFTYTIANRNVANSQVCINANGVGYQSGGLVTPAINTANQSYVVISGKLSNAADFVALESYTVELVPDGL